MASSNISRKAWSRMVGDVLVRCVVCQDRALFNRLIGVYFCRVHGFTTEVVPDPVRAYCCAGSDHSWGYW